MQAKKRSKEDGISPDHVERIGKADNRADGNHEVLAIEATAASKFAWLLSVTISTSGLIFGYDTGYISSVLITIGTSLGHELSSSEQELVTSLTSGGALVGAIFAGLIADRFGRKAPVWAACAFFIVGTSLQAAAYSLEQFSVGRFVVGLGVGLASMIAPLYIGEVAPARYRGRMVGFNNMSVTFGQLAASSIGAGFANIRGETWRGTVAIGASPALVLSIVLFWCPESPRHLVAHSRFAEADAVLQKVYPTSTADHRREKIRSIEFSIHQITESAAADSLWVSFKRIFNTPSTARAVTVACTTMAVGQLGGFNTLMYYSATLFSIVGFDNATAVAITVSGTNFVFSVVNLLLIDRFGRRFLLCILVLGQAICMLAVAISFRWLPVDLKTLELIDEGAEWAGIVVLVAIILYVACYSAGIATVAWIGTELVPIEVRALGTMLNTVTCWSTNIIVSSTFLTMMKALTPSGTFGFYAAICFLGWVFILLCYPDVKGMPLETIRDVFEHGFGLRYSKRWQLENLQTVKTVNKSFAH